jgi:hydrolase, TatD family
MLFDSHAHLYLECFDGDRDEVIHGFGDNGIEMVLVPGTTVETSSAAVRLAEKYDNIFAAVGIHPACTGSASDEMIGALRSLAASKKVVAVGECGLDYYCKSVPKDVQKKWFIEQIKLAKDLRLPVIIHDLEGNMDIYDILKEEAEDNLRGVIHCYSGDVELAKRYADIGFYISLSGVVTYEGSQGLKSVARDLPLKYLLIETDSPVLTPSAIGEKRNEPAFVRYTAEEIAKLKGISYEEVEEQTNKNAKSLFGIK